MLRFLSHDGGVAVCSIPLRPITAATNQLSESGLAYRMEVAVPAFLLSKMRVSTMVQPDDSGRSLWGEPPSSQPPGGGGPTQPTSRNDGRRVGQTAGLVLFLIILLAVYLLTGRPEEAAKAASAGATPFQQTLDRLLPTLLSASLLGLIYSFLFIPGVTRTGRVTRSILSFWTTGVLVAGITYLIMGWLIPYSAFGERLIIPALLLALAVIMGLFAPGMPIWPLNVPDGQLWTILDFGDHFVTYVGPGVHWMRPLDGFEPYQQGGVIIIEIDDEGFRSHDSFPFRVKAKISCIFNPLNAERERWRDLRTVSRERLRDEITDEIRFIIQNELGNDLHAHIRAPGNFQTVLHRISMDIRDAIAARASMGVSLTPNSPINVTLLATDRVVNASEYLAAFEAITGGTRRDDLLQMLGAGVNDSRVLSEVVELATRNGDINISFDAQGNPLLGLTSGEEMDIGQSLSETLIQAAGIVMNAANRRAGPPAEESSARPRALPEQAALSPGEGWEEVSAPEQRAEEQAPPPAEQPPAQRSNAIHVEPGLAEDDVIEVERDSDGVFKVRKNPIIPDDLPDDL